MLIHGRFILVASLSLNEGLKMSEYFCRPHTHTHTQTHALLKHVVGTLTSTLHNILFIHPNRGVLSKYRNVTIRVEMFHLSSRGLSTLCTNNIVSTENERTIGVTLPSKTINMFSTRYHDPIASRISINPAIVTVRILRL